MAALRLLRQPRPLGLAPLQPGPRGLSPCFPLHLFYLDLFINKGITNSSSRRVCALPGALGWALARGNTGAASGQTPPRGALALLLLPVGLLEQTRRRTRHKLTRGIWWCRQRGQQSALSAPHPAPGHPSGSCSLQLSCCLSKALPVPWSHPKQMLWSRGGFPQEHPPQQHWGGVSAVHPWRGSSTTRTPTPSRCPMEPFGIASPQSRSRGVGRGFHKSLLLLELAGGCWGTEQPPTGAHTPETTAPGGRDS